MFDISLLTSVEDGFLIDCLAFLGNLFSVVRGAFDIF